MIFKKNKRKESGETLSLWEMILNCTIKFVYSYLNSYILSQWNFSYFCLWPLCLFSPNWSILRNCFDMGLAIPLRISTMERTRKLSMGNLQVLAWGNTIFWGLISRRIMWINSGYSMPLSILSKLRYSPTVRKDATSQPMHMLLDFSNSIKANRFLKEYQLIFCSLLLIFLQLLPWGCKTSFQKMGSSHCPKDINQFQLKLEKHTSQNALTNHYSSPKEWKQLLPTQLRFRLRRVYFQSEWNRFSVFLLHWLILLAW
jgi:hypothetical protein